MVTQEPGKDQGCVSAVSGAEEKGQGSLLALVGSQGGKLPMVPSAPITVQMYTNDWGSFPRFITR